MAIIQRFTTQLPIWARSDHPLLRYELGRANRTSRRTRYLRIAGLAAVIVLLFWAGYAIATGFFQNAPGQNLTEIAMAIVFWPTLALQVIMQVAALTLTVNTVSEQKRRQTWDSLRATQDGAGLTLRARWVTVYYRLLPLLVVTVVIRVGLIIGILIDLTAFQGRYIDLLLNNVVPEVSPIVGALLLAFLMTASLLLPFTSVGFDSAIGLLVSVTVQQRVYSVMTQIIVVGIRLLILVTLMVGATQFVRGSFQVSDGAAWLLMGGFSALGDWGLSFLHLGFYSEVWATIPYAVFLGIGLLLFAMAQSALSEGILAFAIHRAERSG
ncbi:MAG: hypothetical protein K8L97_04400 [Anaerolineae bacterium]|nr:hypothetical protein [Anaerolineae bacterium]